MSTTSILIRVQAKGGKYVGPDAGYTQVSVTDAETGRVLAQGVAKGGSGDLSPTFTPAATRQPIVTPQPSGTQSMLWLSAPPAPAPPTAGFTATLDLNAPRLLRFTAEALNGDGTPNGHTTTQVMWVAPGADLTAEPGFVLTLPGLIVAVLSATVADGALSVAAHVAMMCGCRIDPSLPWLPGEFSVSATVTAPDGRVIAQVPLVWQSTSTFGTQAPVPLPVAPPFTVTVTAIQAAEANEGSATATVSSSS